MVEPSIWQIKQMQQAYIIWLVVGLIPLILGFKLKIAPQTLWKGNEILRAQREGKITKEIVQVNTPFGQSQIPWTSFIGYGEYKDILVLFQDSTVGVAFAKRFFTSEAEWDSFRVMVAEKLKVSHQVTPVKPESMFVYALIAVVLFILIVRILTR